MTPTDPRVMQAYLDRPLDDLLDELSVYDTDAGLETLGARSPARCTSVSASSGIGARCARTHASRTTWTWRWSSSACSPPMCLCYLSALM